MMRVLLRRLAALSVAVLGWAGAAAALDMGQLTGEVWGSGNRNLVVILHGDGGPGRYDGYAAALANSARGTTVVTLNRPAFSYKGKRSPGQNRSKDHYTSKNNKLLAQSLQAMKRDLGTRNLVVIGHSGGSGQLGTVIGAYPGIVDVAVLAACPCNVPRWRVHRRGQNNWTSSQSPHRFADKIPRSTKVYALTNKRDGNTTSTLAKEYASIAQKAGANVTLIIPERGGHGWSDYQPHVDAILKRELK